MTTLRSWFGWTAGAMVLSLAACKDETTPLDLNGPAAAIALAGGNNQTGAAGSALAQPLVVTVVDANGRPVPAREVQWSTASGALSAAVDSTTDAGESSVVWTMPGEPGQYTATASMSGVGSVTFTANATPPGGALVFRYIDAGSYHACGITTTEELHCWGYNGDGQLGTEPSAGTAFPTPVPGVQRYRIVSGGRYHTCGVTLSGEAFCWGAAHDERIGSGEVASEQFTLQGLQAGNVHTCGVTLSREIWCWGFNGEGQLGTGVSFPGDFSAAPQKAIGDGYKFFTAGGLHGCALREDRTAWCWGFNAESQLGTGLLDRVIAAPTQVVSAVLFRTDPGVVPPAPDPNFPLPPGPFIAAGYSHTCAIGDNALTYCWGLNENGQLGDGSNASRALPTQVATGQQFVRISAGQSHSCGLSAAGTAFCWGDNAHGQLGDGSTTDRLAPAAVSGGLAFSYIKAGELSTCGVTTTGVGYCWGNNEYGQLGNGTRVSSATPVKIAFQP